MHTVPESFYIELNYDIRNLDGFETHWVPWYQYRVVVNPENSEKPEKRVLAQKLHKFLFKMVWKSKFCIFDPGFELLDPKIVQFDVKIIKIG